MRLSTGEIASLKLEQRNTLKYLYDTITIIMVKLDEIGAI